MTKIKVLLKATKVSECTKITQKYLKFTAVLFF